MSIEDIIRAWKADEEALDAHLPASPIGQELSEEELLDVFGGSCISCDTVTGPCSGHTCGCTETYKPLQP